MSHLSKKQLIVIVAATLVILIAALLFVPRNIKLDQLTVKPNALYCLVVFGPPDRTSDDGSWLYDNKIEFHGITIDHLGINYEDSYYYFFEFDSSSKNDLKRIIANKGDYQKTYGGYAHYSYESLDITINDDWFQFETVE